MYIAESDHNSKLTHTGVEIDTCVFQSCHLSSSASRMSLGLCLLTQFQCHDANELVNWQLGVLPQSGGSEFDPRWVLDNLSVASTSKVNQQICISQESGRSSKLTHTGVEIETCAFQTGSHLSNAASGISWGLCLLTRFQPPEANELDNWQVALFSQSRGSEFNPDWVHENLMVPLWVCMHFPVWVHQN